MQIYNKAIKCDNLFIGRTDRNIKIGYSIQGKTEALNADIKGFAYSLIEIYTLADIGYSKISYKHLPNEFLTIDNEKIKEFITACFNGENVENLLSHPFLTYEEKSGNSLTEFIPNEEIYDFSIEETLSVEKFYILIRKNFDIIGKHEFNYYNDVSEQFVEIIINKHNLPEKYFQEILNAIEHHMFILNHNYNTLSPLDNHEQNPFVLALESTQKKKQKLSLNIGIQDVTAFKKLKVDVIYEIDIDTPSSIADEIINHFCLDHSEFNTISRLISEKISNSDFDTQSNFSNPDLLDLTQEEKYHSKPGLNSTTEFSIPSESCSYRSSIDHQCISEFAS